MILDVIDNVEKYKGLHPRLDMALQYLIDTDINSLDDGKYEINGKELYAIVETYETIPGEQKKYEAHRNYIDLQMIIDGQEACGWGNFGGATEAVFTYDESKDLALYEDVGFLDLHLKKGNFAIFFPEDAHRPGCIWEEPKTVKKLVLKIKK